MSKKTESERKTSTRKDIRFNNELLVKINAKRGATPFSTWVQAVCTKAVHTKAKAVHTKGKTVHTNASKADITYAKKHGLPRIITEKLHNEIMQHHSKGLSGHDIAKILPISRSTIQRTITAST